MKILLTVLGVLSIPRYSIRFIVTVPAVLFVLIWLFNSSTVVSLMSYGFTVTFNTMLEGYLNFFRYGFDLTSLLLVVMSLALSSLVVLNQYLAKVNSKVPQGLKGAIACLVGVLLSGIVPQLLSTSVGTGNVRLLTDVFLFISAGVSVYSVIIVGGSIEPTLSGRDEIEHKETT